MLSAKAQSLTNLRMFVDCFAIIGHKINQKLSHSTFLWQENFAMCSLFTNFAPQYRKGKVNSEKETPSDSPLKKWENPS